MQRTTDSVDEGVTNWIGSWFGLLFFLALAAAFVAFSLPLLPKVVASHFAAGGGANGYMPRSGYLILMLGVTVGIPLLVAVMSSLIHLLPRQYVNLPNRDYWLAPERQEETIAYVDRQGRVLGMLLAGFFCYVHWLVVEANMELTPMLDEMKFLAGSLLFLLALAGWMIAFVMHFRSGGR